MESNKINLKLLNLGQIGKKMVKTWDTNAHYNFGIRKFNIIHCQLRNEASNLKAHLFSDFLSDNTNCPNCSGIIMFLQYM
jgi:hypothetical protein